MGNKRCLLLMLASIFFSSCVEITEIGPKIAGMDEYSVKFNDQLLVCSSVTAKHGLSTSDPDEITFYVTHPEKPEESTLLTLYVYNYNAQGVIAALPSSPTIEQLIAPYYTMTMVGGTSFFFYNFQEGTLSIERNDDEKLVAEFVGNVGYNIGTAPQDVVNPATITGRFDVRYSL